MITTDYTPESIFDDDTDVWSAESTDTSIFAVNDTAIWDDIGLVELARGTTEERNVVLGQLLEMMRASLSGYAEIHEFAADRQVQSFAEVILRQRDAQYLALAQQRNQQWDDDSREAREALGAVTTAWRLAVWNLEQDRRAKFLEYAELAESLLEEAFLTSAAAFTDDDWQQTMQEQAVMICGARSIWEELSEDLPDEAEESEFGEILLTE